VDVFSSTKSQMTLHNSFTLKWGMCSLSRAGLWRDYSTTTAWLAGAWVELWALSVLPYAR